MRHGHNNSNTEEEKEGKREMRRCEKGEKLHFLQLSKEFFDEFAVRRLLRAPGGDTMLRIYMQAHCAALDTGGELQLHGDIEPAEEIAILIGAPDEEIPMIATTMQYCLKCGLIRTEKNATEDMVVNFTLTGKFTRAWTREAIERREKKIQEQLETRQEDATALIEMTEETEEERKKSEKKEAAKKKKAEAEAAANEMFEQLWKQYPKKKGKERVKPAAKMKLYKCGEERCQRALDAYKAERAGKDDTYTLYGCNFFNKDIYDYMDMPATKQAQTQAQAHELTEKEIYEMLEADGVTFCGEFNLQRWDAVKSKYPDAVKKFVEKKIEDEKLRH